MADLEGLDEFVHMRRESKESLLQKSIERRANSNFLAANHNLKVNLTCSETEVDLA